LEALELSPETYEDALDGTADPDLPALSGKVRRHPCHACPDRDRHAQWAERASRLERETSGMRKRVRSRTETISRKFERVLEVLEEHRYVEGFTLTAKGRMLARIYNENDLLVAEALSSGWFDGLEAAEIASLASTFVFQSRGPFEISGRLPTAATKRIYSRITRLEQRLTNREKEAGLELTRGTEPGFAEAAYQWCRGAALEEVIDEEMPAGDFIRSCKQTIDLLRQLKGATDADEFESRLASAIDATNRGVVAYTGVV
jgi:ATP-dependent RNA helicase HelY